MVRHDRSRHSHVHGRSDARASRTTTVLLDREGATSASTRLLDLAAGDWGLPRACVVSIALAPFAIVLTGALIAATRRDIYVAVTKEDGPVETLQVLLFLSASILSLAVARNLRRTGQTWLAIMYCGLGAGLLFVTGEEISWGQRIFGWDTPESLALNRQGESNIHNVPVIETAFRVAQVVLGAAGVVLPLLVAGLPPLARYRPTLSWLLPHFTMIPYWGILMVWRLFRMTVSPPPVYSYGLIRFNEIVELVLAMALFMFAWFQFRRSGPPPGGVHILPAEPWGDHPS